MAYVKIIYQNSPSTATPINAQNLNHMDDGIAENDRRLNELETAGVVNKFNNRTGNVTPEKNDYDISLIGATAGEDGYVPVWRNSGTEEDPDWGFEMEAQGGAGHVLVDSDGNDMPSEDKMQFADAFLTDDDVNGKTVVENIKEVLPADYDSTTDEGIIVCDDGEDAVIGPVSDDYVEVEGDGTKTWKALLNELYGKADLTKLTGVSYLQHKGNIYQYYGKDTSNGLSFGAGIVYQSQPQIVGFYLTSTNSAQNQYYSGQNHDVTNNVVNNGEKITLYYGNKKAVVDLQTTANRCLMSDGVTSVEGAINNTFKQYTFDNITLQTTRGYNDLPLSLTSDEISRLLFCNATVVESGVDIYQCYWKSTNNGVRVIGKAQNGGTYTIKVTLVFRA